MHISRKIQYLALSTKYRVEMLTDINKIIPSLLHQSIAVSFSHYQLSYGAFRRSGRCVSILFPHAKAKRSPCYYRSSSQDIRLSTGIHKQGGRRSSQFPKNSIPYMYPSAFFPGKGRPSLPLPLFRRRQREANKGWVGRGEMGGYAQKKKSSFLRRHRCPFLSPPS